MTKQIINVGAAANDKKGDSLRAAFQKVNANFTELYTALSSGVGTNIANTGNIKFVTDFIYDYNGVTIENADETHGATAAVIVPANGTTDALQVNNTYGPVSITSGTNNVTNSWNFGSTGILTLPSSSYLESTDTNLKVGAQGTVTIRSDAASNLTTKEWTFGKDGGLTVPSPQSRTFPLSFGPSNYVSTEGKPNLTLTDTAWAITGGLIYSPDGDYSLVLEHFVPSVTNPGYDTGDTFTFDSTVHGLTDYTLTLTLTNVADLGQGWTSEIAASQLPDYPSTVKSNGAVKITADTNSWAFGTDGKLKLPNNSQLSDGTDDIRLIANSNKLDTFVRVSSFDEGGEKHFVHLVANGKIFRFDEDGKLALPAGGDIVNSSGTSVLGGNANTGSITFADINIYGATSMDFPLGGITLVPHRDVIYTDFGQYVDIYPTVGNDAPHIHIAAGKGGASTGDLILGDDNSHVDVNHNGYISVRSYDKERGYSNYWSFQSDGTLSGPGMGTVIVSGLSGTAGSDLYLTGGGNLRNSTTLYFSDADSTEKNTYTVDTSLYYISNIPPTGGVQLWFAPNQVVYINSIVLDGSNATFTLSQPVTLQAGIGYIADWYGSDEHDVIVNSNNGNWRFQRSGALEQNGSYTRSSYSSVQNSNPSGVVWTAAYDYISSVKLVIQLETNVVGDNTGWHSQVCEAIIASRGYANGTGVGEPVMTVYGVTYTSTQPLATFTVQRNVTTKKIEIVAARTAATTDGLYFKIHSVEMGTSD